MTITGNFPFWTCSGHWSSRSSTARASGMKDVHCKRTSVHQQQSDGALAEATSNCWEEDLTMLLRHKLCLAPYQNVKYFEPEHGLPCFILSRVAEAQKGRNCRDHPACNSHWPASPRGGRAEKMYNCKAVSRSDSGTMGPVCHKCGKSATL